MKFFKYLFKDNVADAMSCVILGMKHRSELRKLELTRPKYKPPKLKID